MNKVKDFFKDKKKILIVVFGVIVLILAVLLVMKVLSKDNAKNNLKDTLISMGRDFYENYYYDKTGKNADERKEFLKKFEKQGIKIDLDNLGRYNSNTNKEKLKEFVNPTTEESCNYQNTKAIIYPKGNFGKTDYDIEVILDCGFDTEEEK